MTKVGGGSKFYRKSRTLLAAILRLANDNLTQTQIARTLKMHKSNVHYHLKMAEKEGYIHTEVRDVVKVITLTQRGRKFLETYENDDRIPLLRLENIRFKAPIVQLTDRPLEPDWKRIQLHNWVQYQSGVDRVFVRINDGKHPNVEFQASAIDGHDPWDMVKDAYYECQRAAEKLQDLIGLKIGHLEVSSRPEWVIYDPVAREFCKYNGQITIHRAAKINASAPRSLGEFEFCDPYSALEYLRMPRTVCDMNERISRWEAKESKEQMGAWHFKHTRNN